MADGVAESKRARWLRVARRAVGFDVPSSDHTVAQLHRDEHEVPGLDERETRRLRYIRLFGATGTILMATGALGVGAQPVLQNPTFGVRILGLFARTYITAMTITMTGTVMVVLAWLLLGRYAIGRGADGEPPRRMSRSQLDRTLLLWIIPLSVAPPMFSRDVYSYLAQSEIAARGLDPYTVGPRQAFGDGYTLTRTIPNIWRETPAPYGPLSLWLGRGIAHITGENIIAGVFLHRLLAIGGVALIVWALPRLAKRCGVSAVSALWLGAANPLLLFHLVSGVHNEALMIGLMLAGMELALQAISSSKPLRGRNLVLLLGGCTLIAIGSTIKIPAIIVLGFVGMALAYRWGPSLRSLVAAALLLGTIATIVTVSISFGSGLGFGWLHTLGTANAVRSWMSLPTSIGVITGFGGVLLGLGDHTTALLTLTRPIAALCAAVIGVRMLLAVYTNRIHPVGALGVALGAMVLLFPVVQPWYLLWAVVPLAAWATRPIFRIPTICLSSLVAVILMPSGKDEEPFVIVQAAIATVIICGALILATRNVLPWRREDGANANHSVPNAYAESS